MPPDTFTYTTGPATLQDVGELSYNGCLFSPLYATKISGTVVRDAANRTTRYMEYTLIADGYVTLPAGASDINGNMNTLRRLLTAQGGRLRYTGRGFNLNVNPEQGGRPPVRPPAPGLPPGGGTIVTVNLEGQDVAWGPIPELIEFQPLGAGRSAKIQWKCTTRIPEVKAKGKGLIQFNYDCGVSYGEDGYSSLTVRGTIEIPMTRTKQDSREVIRSADDFRSLLETRVLTGIDLENFRITKRDFQVSRDKRTLEFDVAAEERPYMDMPAGCTVARGNFTVRPTKVGAGLINWLCTLRATYTVALGTPRRIAWLNFLALLRLRMNCARPEYMPEIPDPQDGKKPPPPRSPGRKIFGILFPGVDFGLEVAKQEIQSTTPGTNGIPNPSQAAWLIDFSIDEGIYLDSKTISFSATWRVLSKFQYILYASGIWKKLPERDAQDRSLWATTMQPIQRSQSWLVNNVEPALDVIVDFGGPDAL